MEFWIGLLFTTAVGACVGSFLNVVAFRIPAGISLVKPRSACPKCRHVLRWSDNIPVLGWWLLRGRCRYCRKPISGRYPIVEATVAVLFGGWFAICYAVPLRPGFYGPGPVETAGVFAVTCVLIAALVGACLVDAEWTIIPLRIPYFAAAFALVALPVSVMLFPRSVMTAELPSRDASGRLLALSERMQTVEPPLLRRSARVEEAVVRGEPGPVQVSAAPLAGGALAVGACGATAGLGVSLLLLGLGVLPRSFDFEEQDEEPLKPMPQNIPALFFLLAPVGGAVAAGLWLSSQWQGRWLSVDLIWTVLASMAAAYTLVAVLAVALARHLRPDGEDPLPQQTFAEPENPRREACKELLFLCLPIAGAVLGWLWADIDAWQSWLQDHPAVAVFLGSLGGALAGAAVAWALRVLGTLGFGREAMGLGDVHLMVGIGAVVGWRSAVMIFLFAAFVGLAHTAMTVGLGKLLHLRGSHVPYGPHLAGSTVFMMILQEPAEAYFAIFIG
ncbi:MAG: prepilin peptidase [Phycisphaeraceae bacterium]|nr:prepilin peptidase [Phycisphaeraceae bacterium]